MKFIDLSIPIINPEEAVFDPPLTQPKIEYTSHDEGAMQMGFVFPRLKPEKHLPDGKGWAVESITLGTHSGTHMDAPWHFAPIQDKEVGQSKAMTKEDFPKDGNKFTFVNDMRFSLLAEEITEVDWSE